MSSLKPAFKAFDTQSQKVVKYSFMDSDTKYSLRLLKTALKESVEKIESRNARTKNYYSSDVILVLVQIMNEITDRMKKFDVIAKRYTINDNISGPINDLFEIAHECVNQIVTYREEEIDDDFDKRLIDVDDIIHDAKTPTPKARTPTPRAKTPSPKPKSKTARCPRGTRRNKKTGNCEASKAGRTARRVVADAASPASAPKMKRCPRGSRRNKKTGNCDPNK